MDERRLEEVRVQTPGGAYRVVVGPGAVNALPTYLDADGLAGRVRLIADATVFALHGERVVETLRAGGRQVSWALVPPGEERKNLDEASRLYDWLVECGTERGDLVLALGGGVVGDLAGFVAATFLRGLRFVQVPTTLLAQVDASVGGKVGVNHPRGKNLIGAFHQPSLVIADVDLLRSLPQRELTAGWSEVVKTAAILDAPLFEALESRVDAFRRLDDGVAGVVRACVALKARVVEADERESGLRMILNYGHTTAHAVEAVTDYRRYLHGEAVAIGMVVAARLSEAMGLLDGVDVARQVALIERFGLPTRASGLDVESVLDAMHRDKKARDGQLTWVLLTRIGEAVCRRDVPLSLVRRVLAEVLE
ncbi:MAG TPA: 3-dehydroquinate synthase [Chloroflexota bacterium]